MDSIKSAIVANYVGQGWVAIMNVIFIPFYIHFLGVTSYGLIGAFSILATCALLLDAGLSPTLNREMAKYRARAVEKIAVLSLLRSVELLYFTIIVAFVAASYFGADWLAKNWLGERDLPLSRTGPAIFLMLAVAVTRVGEGIYRGALLGLGKHVAANLLVSILATLRSGGAVLAIMFIAPTERVFFAWQAFVSLLGLALLGVSLHRSLDAGRNSIRPSFDSLRSVGRFATGVFATTFLSLVLTQADKIMLVRLLPLRQFAYYSIASTVVAGLYQLVAPVAQSYYPRFTHFVTVGDEDNLAANYHQGSQIMSMLVLPVAMMLIVASKDILQIWTQNVELSRQTSILLSLLAAGTMLHAMMYMPYMLQLASAWTRFSIIVNAVAVAMIFPSILYVVPRFGAIGAAMVWAALNVGYLVFSIHFMHKRLLVNEKWRWYISDVGAPLLSVTIVGCLALLVRPDFSGEQAQIAWLALLGSALMIASIFSTATARRLFFDMVTQLRLWARS